MVPDEGNPSTHVLYSGFYPVISFCHGSYMIAFFITSLPCSFENLWTGWNKSWRFLDWQLICFQSISWLWKFTQGEYIYIASIFGFNLLPHDFCYIMYFNFFVVGPHLSSQRKTLTKPDVFNEINKRTYLHASHCMI